MQKLTKKQILYVHIIEARKQGAMYARRAERFEDAGRTERSERAHRIAVDCFTKASAYISAVTIVYGEYGCDLERRLKEFADAYFPEKGKETTK